ncbi:MAG: hypothetical protein HY260_17970, partial [Chloroflexi bacterium]|nr:hypothetical protein [Chloroflexota bacterium]
MTSTQPSAAPARPGCLTYLLFAAASFWIVLITVLYHLIAWVVDQSLLISGAPLPWFAWPLISWGHGLLLALPILPLAFLVRAPRFRAVYQTWALAVGYLFVLALPRFFPAAWSQPASLAQIVLSGLCAAGLLIFARTRGHKIGRRLGALGPALALAPIVALPWLAYGALGSPLDAVLDLLAGLSLGLFAGLLIGLFLLQPITEQSAGPGRDVAFGGFAAGVALLILGSGFGFGGSQLLLIIGLP